MVGDRSGVHGRGAARPRRFHGALLALVGSAALVMASGDVAAFASNDCVISITPDSTLTGDGRDDLPFTVSVNEGPGVDVCSGASYSLSVLNDTTMGGVSVLTSGFAPATGGSGSGGTSQNYFASLPSANGPGTATIRAECTGGCPMAGSFDEVTVSLNTIDLAFTAPAPAGQVNGTINTDLAVPIRLTRNGVPIPDVTLGFAVTGTGGGLGPGGGSAFDSGTTDSNGVATVNFRATQEGNFSVDVNVSDCDFFGAAKQSEAKGCLVFDSATIAVTIAINRTLTISAGDNSAGQTGDVANLVVQALDDGVPASTSIDWVILEGSDRATLGSAGPGGSPGLYQIPVTFAANTGLVRVEARRLDMPSAAVVFTLENFAYQLERLNPADGINSGPTNSDIGYQVRLNRVGITTTGVAGNTVNWSQSGPATGTFLTQGGGAPSTSSVTDGAGIAAIDFRTATNGQYTIEASSAAPAPAGPVSFTTSVFAQQLSSDSQPAGPNFTDETTGGVSVLATNQVGTPSPISGVPVTFTITGGQATFVGGATTAGPVSTDTSGRAASPGIVVGRGTTNITIAANAPGRPTVNFSLPVTASTYTLSSATTAYNVLTQQNLSLPVNLQRQGSSTPLPLAGANVSWQISPATGAALNAPTTTTDSAGDAPNSFTASSPGNYTVTATFDPGLGAGAVTTVEFQVTVAAPTLNLAADSQPAGPIFTDESTGGVGVLATDGNAPSATPASGVPVTFTITGGQATFVGGATTAGPVATDTAGRAASPGIVVGRGTTSITIAASAAGRPTVNFSLPVTASTYTLSGTGSSFSVLTGETLSLPVTLQRQGSSAQAPLSGASISWQVSPATGAAVGSTNTITDSTGDGSNTFVASAGGTYTVTATFDPGFTPPGPSSVSFTVNVATPSLALQAISGDGQTGGAGTVLPAPLVVRALNNGLPASGIGIVWTASGGATLSSGASPGAAATVSDTTNTSGDSSVLVTLPDSPDTEVMITAARLDAPATTASFVVRTARATLIELLPTEGDGQTGAPGSAGQPLGARLLADGQPVGNATVRWEVVNGSATVSPAASTTDAQGIARTNLQFGTQPGQQSVIRASSGADAETFFTVTTTGNATGAPVIAIASGNNQTALPGQTLGADFVVVVSGGGEPRPGFVVNFSVSPSDGRLSATQAVTDNQGRAATRLTFGSASSYQVVAALDEVNRVTFTAGPPNNRLNQLRGNRQSGVLGSRLDQPLEVELLSPTGAPVAQTAIQWRVDGNGDATLGGTGATVATSLTNAQGIATISVELGTTTASSTLRFRASTPSAEGVVEFIAESRVPGLGPVGGNDQPGVINMPLPQPLTLQITEGATGKSLLGVPVRWTVGEGSGSLANATTTTDAQGRTSNTWTLGSLVGTQRVTATLPGGATVEFRSTASGAVSGSRLVRVSGDGQSLVTGAASAPLVVEVRDASNVLQPGVPVVWAIENSDGSASTLAAFENGVTRTVTAGSGQARNVVVFASPGSVVVRARLEGAPAGAESVSFALQAGITPIATLSPVARDVGEALDEFCDDVLAATSPDAGTTDLGSVCTVLNDNADEDPAGVGEALEELQNDVAPTLGNSGIDAINTQFDNLDIRLHMIRGEQFGGRQNQFNIGLWTPDGVLPLSFLPSIVVAAAEEEASSTEEVGADFGRWGFFATGQIGRGEAEAGLRSPQFDFDIAGLTAGVDYRFSDRLVGGVALGYSDNDAELGDGRGTLDSKGWNIAGYATWYNEQAWFFDATAMFGQIDYDLRRRIFFSLANRDGGLTTIDQVASGSTDGDTLGASFSVGRDWQKGPWNLTGYLKGNYSKVDTDAYTESLIAGRPGEGLGLIIESRSTTSMTSIFGGRATYIMSRDWGILMPTATVEWEHEFEDDPNRVIARFAFDPTGTRIVRDGDDVDSNYFNVGVGISALFPGGRSAYMYYEELVGASRLSQGLLSLGVRFEF